MWVSSSLTHFENFVTIYIQFPIGSVGLQEMANEII